MEKSKYTAFWLTPFCSIHNPLETQSCLDSAPASSTFPHALLSRKRNQVKKGPLILLCISEAENILTLVEGKAALLAWAGSQHPISKDDSDLQVADVRLGWTCWAGRCWELPEPEFTSVLKSPGCFTFLPNPRYLTESFWAGTLSCRKNPSLNGSKHRPQWWLLWTPLSCAARTGEVTFHIFQGHLHLHGHLFHIFFVPLPLQTVFPILPCSHICVFFRSSLYYWSMS